MARAAKPASQRTGTAARLDPDHPGVFLLAGINLLTKEAATVGGVSFTLVCFILLTVFERRAGRRDASRPPDRFRLEVRESLSKAPLGVRPEGVVIGVHDPEYLAHLDAWLERSDPAERDIVLVAVNSEKQPESADDDALERVVGPWGTLRVHHRCRVGGKGR